MITINETGRELTKVEKYLMTQDNNVVSIKDVEDGSSIPVDTYCVFTDTKEDGTEAEILSILADDKKVYATQSETFKRSFKDMYNTMDGDKFSFIKTSGQTKAGRPFVNCSLDIDSLE
jgi:hypothetical protein